MIYTTVYCTCIFMHVHRQVNYRSFTVSVLTCIDLYCRDFSEQLPAVCFVLCLYNNAEPDIGMEPGLAHHFFLQILDGVVS